jgi:hypothetical protein
MSSVPHSHSHADDNFPRYKKSRFSQLFNPLRDFVDRIEVKNYHLAHLLCQLIPCCCPFERDVNLFGWTLNIPPLCKFNPLYDEFVNLRLRALSYLADECGEDITKYIC